MNAKDKEIIEQQRQRRKRVDRIRTGIVMTIAIWIIISLVAIVVMGVSIVKLNSRIYKLELKLNASVSTTYTMPDDTETAAADVSGDDTSVSETDTVVRQLYSEDNVYSEGDTRKVYLTFDCSPSENTIAILDALQESDTKATFFVTCDTSGESDDIYRRIVSEGHTLAMYSYSNSYSQVYESIDSFTSDIEQLSDYITNVTGYTPGIYRFPGGSMNQISNVDMTELVKVLNGKGLTYFDWNVSANDTSDGYTVNDVVDSVTSGVLSYKTSVVLLHDDLTKTATTESISTLIEQLNALNAEILPIDENTYVVQYIKADTVE